MTSGKFTGMLKAKGKEPIPAAAVSSGRQPGKSKDPQYTQTTIYLKKTTHQETKLVLLKQGGERDFSDLVEELLAAWLAKRK